MAGEASRKLKLASVNVRFDFDAVALTINVPKQVDATLTEASADKAQATDRIEKWRQARKRIEIVNALIAVLRAAFPTDQRGNGTMTRHDGRIWSGWQDDIESEEMSFDLPLSSVSWLLPHLESEKLGVDPGNARAREALADYLAQLRDAAQRGVEVDEVKEA